MKELILSCCTCADEKYTRVQERKDSEQTHTQTEMAESGRRKQTKPHGRSPALWSVEINFQLPIIKSISVGHCVCVRKQVQTSRKKNMSILGVKFEVQGRVQGKCAQKRDELKTRKLCDLKINK